MTLPEGAVCLYAEGAQNRAHFDRGIPRYVVEHLRALSTAEPEAIDSVHLNRSLPLTGNLSWLLGTGLLAWGCVDGRIAGRPVRSRARIYHVMSPFELGTTIDTMWPRWARAADVATVVTLYDLIPLVFPDHYLSDPRVRVEYAARLDFIRAADQVLAISQATADDAVSRLGIPADHVHVIHAGATQTFAGMYASRDAATDHLRRHIAEINRGFLLYVGGFEFRKNLDGLIKAYGRLDASARRECQLVIACRLLPEQKQMLRQLAANSGIGRDELVLTGYVSDAELGALYHACKLFVFPSLYEGSGLPILEAMSCGAPVAAGRVSTGLEVLGDHDASFEPHDPDSIAACLGQILTSPSMLERLRSRSVRRVTDYTWRRVADESLTAYARAITNGSRRRCKRHRLALVTPWLPERSGIADYNLRLAREIGHDVDVDIIVGGYVEDYPAPLERGVRLVGYRDMEAVASIRQYDRVLYCMGNSRFHAHTYELLRRRPGAVLFHDVQLTGFYGSYAGSERPENPQQALAERIHAMYGDRIPPDAIQDAPPTWDRQLALGIYMTRELQSYAEDVFVHSRYAHDIMELDRGMFDRQVPVSVLPFGMPEASASPRTDATDNPLVISLGYVHEVKGLAALILAFAILSAEMPTARLVIAGPTDAAESERWKSYVGEHAPEANIDIPGHISTEDYSELLRRADLAVQLRLVSNGEASAAVADCLAGGVPTIVTDLGWAGELPAGVVEKVPLGVQPELLCDRMRTLITDVAARTAMSRAALDHARACSFTQVAKVYRSVLGLT